jgi:hypothetical protein
MASSPTNTCDNINLDLIEFINILIDDQNVQQECRVVELGRWVD